MMKDYSDLIRMAIDQLHNSYAPYSRYHVAAALLTKDGRVYCGVNIENAAYTPTICAERTAVFKAVSEGEREFSAIAVVAGDGDFLESCDFHPEALPTYATPCGTCRQVLREFCDPKEFDVVLARSPEDYKVYKLEKLLPVSFGPEFLFK
ncbi:MAG: cytidine deaminase [Lachnospiraceae bacterium]|nr:cytidine deaminase [Lachnospiraceae bacterium]